MASRILTLKDMIFDDDDLGIATRTVFGEARGEEYLGKISVMWVILNRALRPGWWSRQEDDIKDDTIAAVCKDSVQFSCWSKAAWNAENYRRMVSATMADTAMRDCAAAVAAVLSGLQPDVTRGATHYHTTDVAPSWSRELTPCFRVGRHIFYNNVP